MVDTIKFLIPFEDIRLIKELENNLTRFRKENLKTKSIEFEFHKANIELGSYERNVSIFSSNNPEGFFIEFSLPKYIKGNNVEMIYPHEIPSIMEKLYPELCKFMNHDLPHFSLWQIYRLDICYNWLFKDESEAIRVIDFLKRIDFARKKKYVWDTSIMYKGSTYIVKFYAKGAEFLKNDFKELPIERSAFLYEQAKRIVRFEVGIKRQQLKELFLNDKIYLKDIIDDSVMTENLAHYLSKVFFYINPKQMKNSEITELLLKNFTKSKATRLFQFYKSYHLDDEAKDMIMNGGLNRSTIYRYKKDLKKAGVGFSVENKNGESFLNQLVIPSPNVQFDFPNYKANIPI